MLFPGLYSLTVKQKESFTLHDGEHVTLPVVDSALCVMPLKQQSLGPLSKPNINLKDKSIAGISRKSNSRHRSTTSPRLEDTEELCIGSVGIGLASLPPIDNHITRRQNSNPSKNSGRSGNLSREASPSTVQRIPMSINPDRELPPLGASSVCLIDRLNHAEELRKDLKKADKDRLQKQRREREERVRRNQSNNESNHDDLNMLMPRIDRTETLEPKRTSSSQQRIRSETSSKAKSKTHQRSSMANSHLASIDLSVQPRTNNNSI